MVDCAMNRETDWRPAARLWLVVLAFPWAFAGLAGLTAADLKIAVGKGDSRQRQSLVKRLAFSTEREIRFWCQGQNAAIPVRFLPAGRAQSLRRSGCVFGLKNAGDRRALVAELTRALLGRRALALSAATELAPEDVPQWLVAAIAFRVRMKDAKRPPGDWYVGSRILAAERQLPDLRFFVDHPFTPAEPLFYELYAESSACLLRVLQQADPRIVPKLLHKLDSRKKPSELLLELLPVKGDAKRVQAWYTKRVRQLTLRQDMFCSAEEIRRQLQKLETVSVKLPEGAGNGGSKETLLEDVPRDYKHQPGDLDKVQQELYKLLAESPPLLAPALERYIAAVKLLRRGKKRRFRKKIKAARKQFQHAYKQARKVREYLVSLEQRRYPPAKRLVRYFPLLEAGFAETEFDKALKSYLDTFEEEGRQ